MKESIRSLLRKKRNAMHESEVLEKSRRIKAHLFSMQEFQKARTILFYVSYDNEVNTHEMIQESLRMKKHIAVPVSDAETRTIICSTLSKWDDLSLGAYNILEPRKDCIEQIAPTSIDLILLPGIAFDSEGNRIGHGKGYYDRLLQNNLHANRFGLAFEFQIVEKIPTGKHDRRVEKIITEDRIINCTTSQAP
ncbi:MAG: 5-formyltetrahydrofolate cyclo-ligase [Candidatus Thermoplasmatota archaeon]|nr:5-formyltetrahydrofolate cyclo-ligase [Candidatus Thermoplasmatota archaeon]